MDHIIIIKNLLQREQTITLADSEFTIGRKGNNSLVIKSHLISRYHATISPVQDRLFNEYSYWIVDGNLERGCRSTNGIMVNNKKILMYKLEAGDVITLPNQVQIIYQQVEQQDTKEITMDIMGNNEDIEILQERTTLSQLEESLASLNHPTLVRLASFTELSSFAIIEISVNSEITCINTAAVKIFHHVKNNQNHPIIKNMIQLWNKREITSEVVELVYENNVFEQHMYKIEEHKLIRSYILDVNNRKNPKNMLEYTAFHDDLTGLYNRRFFKQKISELLTDNLNTKFAIIFLDLDRFKNINNVLGHDFGDIVLQNFALRL
jgi:GGDEF domain-containing protein